MSATTESAGTTWLLFALATVGLWGLYGGFLHKGQLNMGDPENGRYKAFLIVGVAYFLSAIVAPALLLMVKGASWSMPAKGIAWSLLAGLVGALGAFFVLMAFGAKGKPAVVMTLVFAGAPIINALYSLLSHPPAGGWTAIRWQFALGIALAAAGGGLVTLYKPT